MTYIEMLSILIASLVIPYGVQLIKTKAIGAKAARWLAIGTSLVAGLLCGLVGGVPTTPAALLTCAFATIGGVQTAYAAYRSVGFTNKWLESLQAVGDKETIAGHAKDE